MIYPMLRATLLVIVSTCALNAQVTFDRILRADKEPQNWLTYSGQHFEPALQPAQSDHARECRKHETPVGVSGALDGKV